MTITPGQVGGKLFNAVSTTIATGSNVTAGRVLIIKVTTYNAGGGTVEPVVTKASGSATIGPQTTDDDLVNAFDSHSRLTILRIPITGSGNLTLNISCPGATNCVVSYVEVQSDAVIEVAKLPPSTSGTVSPETTGTITLTRPGLIESVAAELSSGDFTYTPSDTVEFSQPQGTLGATSIMQYKNITTPAGYAVTSAMSVAQTWACLAAVYQETQKGVYTDQPRKDVPFQQRQAA